MIIDFELIKNIIDIFLLFKEVLVYLFLLINIGFLNLIFHKQNFIIILLSFELILFSLGLLFIIFAINYGTYIGFIYSLVLVTIASCESVIGLSLLTRFYMVIGHINIFINVKSYG